MRVLLLRPDPGNERFGLGPFFRVEPLGLEYIASALLKSGHEPTIADLRFRPNLATWLKRSRPQAVGISAMHSLEFDQVLDLAREVKRRSPETFVFVGGHAAAAYPAPFDDPAIDALVADDGEDLVPMLVDAILGKRPMSSVPALRYRSREGLEITGEHQERTGLDEIPTPARELVSHHRDGYHCLLFKPVWLIETARGCPFRCSFCSVWQLYGRSFRERSIGKVADDFEATGKNVFVVDDLFWNHPARSLELARELLRRGVKKNWILVQSRCDLVARNAELLEAWRPLAKDFDIFFGLEAATDSGLSGITKDASTNHSIDAAEVARSMRYGVTGNFLVDPDWEEDDFERLWDFVQRNGFQRAGYTILTPLPGTELFERMEPLLRGQPWFKFDMHHVLWEPKLGAKRFFELYAETWRRSILNLSGAKKWTDWVRQIHPLQIPYLTRVLSRTQRMMKPEAYLAEHEEGVRTKSIVRNTSIPAMMSAPSDASAQAPPTS